MFIMMTYLQAPKARKILADFHGMPKLVKPYHYLYLVK